MGVRDFFNALNIVFTVGEPGGWRGSEGSEQQIPNLFCINKRKVRTFTRGTGRVLFSGQRTNERSVQRIRILKGNKKITESREEQE